MKFHWHNNILINENELDDCIMTNKLINIKSYINQDILDNKLNNSNFKLINSYIDKNELQNN